MATPMNLDKLCGFENMCFDVRNMYGDTGAEGVALTTELWENFDKAVKPNAILAAITEGMGTIRHLGRLFGMQQDRITSLEKDLQTQKGASPQAPEV
jgi:hypothetical protein